MNRDKQFTNQVFRDGVSQGDRFLKEIESDYISVEERDKKDLINFAQKFAQYLNFYDDSNQLAGDWSSFFAGDVAEMVAYIDNPESFADDQSKFNWLSQPHLVLFFTFLELLRYPQQQFKALNQRYLNFYYQHVLKLTEKSEVADQVHTILELASGLDNHLLEKGTLINGGEDQEGNELNYVIDQDIVINQAQVASLKNIFLWKKHTSLKDIHQPNKSNRSFEKMLCAAVGSPNQGDPLPNFAGTEVDIDFLNDLYQEIKELYNDNIIEARRNYILQQLFFVTIDDFKYCLEIHYRQVNNNDPDLELPTKVEWEKVYELVEKAYRKKINYQRRSVLEQERLNPKFTDDNDAFKSMMRLALGNPDPGNPLPELPSRFDDFDDFCSSMVSIPDNPADNLKNKVMEVDGVDDYIEVPYSTTLNPNHFTISCWVKVTGKQAAYRSPVASRASSGCKGYLFYAANNNKWQFWLGKRNKRKWATIVGSNVVLNTWTHLVGTYDGSKMKFYINGELTGNEVRTDFNVNPIAPLVIGARNTLPTCCIPSQISEVRLWNFARTPNEIKADMYQRLTGGESGLVGYWALNKIEENSQQVLDLSGNNNHGTVNGATIVDDSDFPIARLADNESASNEFNDSVGRYIKEQLYLSVADFEKIINTKEKADSTDAQWQEVYRLLEKAQTKKRNFTYPPIGKTKVENIYANALVDAAEEEVLEAKRFTTFANVTNNITDSAESQDNYIGFAIASPILALKQGSRTITVTLGCQENTLNRDIFPENPDEQMMLFDIYLSGEQEWIEVTNPVIRVGDFILEPELKSYNMQLTLDSTSLICTASQDVFVENDRDRFLVFTDGKIYRITAQLSERQVQLELVGESDSPPDTVKQYSSSGVYPHSLQFQFNLGDKLDPITTKSELALGEITVDSPVVKFLLKSEDRGGIASYYEQLQSIRISKAKVQVAVENIQDIQLRNDNSVLDSKSPFNPFGNYPKVGSSFYFSNAEIIHKKLDSLTLNLEWMGLPADFGTHYQAYSSSGVINNAIANDSFQASLHLLNNRRWVEVEDNKAIFNLDGDTLSPNTSLGYHDFNLADYTASNSLEYLDEEDPFEQSRYFKLELKNQGFVQDLYPIVLSKIAISTDDNLKSLTVYPPYTPEIKSISLSYTASEEINLSNTSSKPNPNQIFQLHPFGYGEIRTFKPNNPDNPDSQNNQYYLLPQYPETGALYIGIRDLEPPQNLSILWQMVAGSGQIDLAQPDITWSYLSGAYWRDFAETEILADSTNGLIDTGIIRFQIPAAATQEHQLLPQGLTWLRATVTENPAAVPDILDIKTQAVRATYLNQDNAAEHLNQPLPAESIQGLVTRDPAIQTVQQPYTSFGGKPKEDSRAFSIRVSERLRHKQRALTPWDYEHLVLEHFPAIYKAKCITSAIGSKNPGAAEVTIIVIPDISHTAPFFPLEPKVPFYLLKQIEDYLNQYTSPFVNLVVKNPRYQQIQYRVGVSFRAGYEPGYYRTQLNEDIKRYLSPWAYEEQADITFGSSIYSSTIIHFIEKRPYVDYIAKFKLIEQTDSETNFPRTSTTYPNLAQVKSPDSILVSAPEHIIDLVTADSYDDEDFEGIGYMIINTDFVIQ